MVVVAFESQQQVGPLNVFLELRTPEAWEQGRYIRCVFWRFVVTCATGTGGGTAAVFTLSMTLEQAVGVSLFFCSG